MNNCSTIRKKLFLALSLLGASVFLPLGIGLSPVSALSVSHVESLTKTKTHKKSVEQKSTSTGNGGHAKVNLNNLAALHNYSAEVIDNGILAGIYRVYSPNDWEMYSSKKTLLEIDIKGIRYLHMPVIRDNKVYYSWKKEGPATSYTTTPYPNYAHGFASETHITGVKLVAGGHCKVAGMNGVTWFFKPSVKGAVYPHVNGCIAKSSGVLLSYNQLPLQQYKILSINNIKPIKVP